MAAARRDDVEEIAMIAARGIGPFSRRSAIAACGKPDVEAPSRRVTGVANHPIMALAATAGKITTAHRLGIICETARDI
jgi:hypothetical protein